MCVASRVRLSGPLHFKMSLYQIGRALGATAARYRSPPFRPRGSCTQSRRVTRATRERGGTVQVGQNWPPARCAPGTSASVAAEGSTVPSSAYTAWALSRSAMPRVNCWSSITGRTWAEDGRSLLIFSPETQRAKRTGGLLFGCLPLRDNAGRKGDPVPKTISAEIACTPAGFPQLFF